NGRVIESMLDPDKKRIIERYEPMGVVGIISPFNFPLLLPAYLIAPALAAGNSVVFKPSELSPFSGMKLVEILNEIEVEDEFLGKAKLSDNTINIVTGDSSTGKALVEHKDISMVGFTGSVETGRDIIQSSTKEGEQPKKLLLELGGNCPAVVFDDADLDRAAELCAYGSFTYCGEVCISTQRIYVQEKIYDEFLKKLIAAKDEFKPGPIRTREFLGRVEGFIDDAKKKGAKTYGGNSQGLTLEPTVIEMSHDMAIAKDEVFAPVVGVMRFKTEEVAVGLANSTRHGLSAAVFTRDLARGMRVAEKIKSGTVVINDTTQWFEPHVAFGGYKWSGLGREGGFHAIREFSRIKTIVLDIS
ncbi:MAG: aldehyde dehydrogenase family protein, partial [Candidatus Altiarchaeota archaeon]|nr:aldehyde dehydrogenase family protein [Candidatus Altiarchaeota archaeon]